MVGKETTKGTNHFVAGAIAGTVAAVITCPLEVIKTRLQSDASSRYMTRGGGGWLVSRFKSLNVGATIIRTEGVRGLWRGVLPTLIGVAPARAMHFSTYNVMKQRLNPEGKTDCWTNLVSGAFAGVCSTTAVSPIWMVKTRIQLGMKSTSPVLDSVQGAEVGAGVGGMRNCEIGVIDTVRNIYRNEGIRAFYKGLGASYFAVAEFAIHVSMYERFKASALEWKIQRTADNNRSMVGVGVGVEPGLSVLERFLVAAVVKGGAASLIYPVQVVRTRVRQQITMNVEKMKYRGVIQSLLLIAKEEGRAGLYGGLGAHLLRVVPNASIVLLIVDALVTI